MAEVCASPFDGVAQPDSGPHKSGSRAGSLYWVATSPTIRLDRWFQRPKSGYLTPAGVDKFSKQVFTEFSLLDRQGSPWH